MADNDLYITLVRQKLTEIGFRELKTAEEVRDYIENTPGTIFVLINSNCGCAATIARPGVTLALTHKTKPDHLVTVFAGQDIEATQALRSYIPYPPSSPSMVLFKDGKVQWFLPREEIENRSAEQVAQLIVEAFNQHCVKSRVS